MARLPLYLNTRTFTSHLLYGPYVFFPIIASLTWLGGILALLGLWVHSGKPRYQSTEASVVFISDVGAAHQTVFIAISCVTAGFYILSLFAERWLRHIDRLPADVRRREAWFDVVAIFFGIAGATGLVLLSVFNAFDHSTIHWSMTVVFVLGVAISAIFQTAEVWSLHKDHPDRRSLLRNSILKAIIVFFAIAGAIGFAACYGVCHGDSDAQGSHTAAQCNKVTSAAAALEWTISIILSFYFMTLAADLWPAGKSSQRYLRRLVHWQEKHGEGHTTIGRPPMDAYLNGGQNGLDQMSKESRLDTMKRAMWQRNAGVPVTTDVRGQAQNSQNVSPASQVGSQAPMVTSRNTQNDYPGYSGGSVETMRSDIGQTPPPAELQSYPGYASTPANAMPTTRRNDTNSPLRGSPISPHDGQRISPTSQVSSQAPMIQGGGGYEEYPGRWTDGSEDYGSRISMDQASPVHPQSVSGYPQAHATDGPIEGLGLGPVVR